MKEAYAKLGVQKFLVVAPMLAGQTTWPDTLAGAWPQANVTMIVGGSVAKREGWLEALRLEDPSKPDIVICNYEAIAPLYEALADWGPQGIVADEIHLIRSAGAKRTRSLVRLGDKAVWRRGLTGTPTPRDYGNIYAQYRFLDSSIFGTNQEAFRRRYIVSHPVWKNKVMGYTNLPELQKKMHSIASVVLRKDVFGKDGVQPPVTQDIVLPKEARKLYDTLCKEYVLEIEGRKEAVSHKLSRLNTLAQLASGFVYGEDGKATWVHDAKIKGLLEEMEDYFGQAKPAVIFYRFDAEGERIERELSAASPSNGVVRVSRHTKPEQRIAALRTFGKGGPRYLILQEQVGSLGISLAEASTCIFFSHSFAYDVHVQARDRIWKPGEEPLLYVYLRTRGTVDYFSKQIIDRKEQAENMIMSAGSFARAAKGEV